MPEDDIHRYEVVGRALLVSPAPAHWHQAVARRLFLQLRAQCPQHVEVVSPSSRGMDRIVKPSEYAAAGVPYYWRVETEPDLEVVACSLREGSYVEAARAATAW